MNLAGRGKLRKRLVKYCEVAKLPYNVDARIILFDVSL
jgi:hypothetical protein